MLDKFTKTFGTLLTGDLIAGVSVAAVLIPQALAYAELAGLPPHLGLYAAAFPPLVSALFASSPYLQTGPVALTSLLTFDVLSSLAAPDSAALPSLAALLALIVGIVRLLLGLFRSGTLAYLLSQPVMTGFTTGAALLILASQLPAALGVTPPPGHQLYRVGWLLVQPLLWQPGALLFSVSTFILIWGLKLFSPLFPAVLLTLVIGSVSSLLLNYQGEVIGTTQNVLLRPSLDLPWAALPQLLIGGIVIAVVGFAETASIARFYAVQKRQWWNQN
jgi:sulfate permease, SulP family